VKRVILALAVLGALAAAYVYVITKRENSHRELIRQGDAAMAAGDLSTAIEAFSGAITLKGDAMIGYLMRGDAYRRRDELEAALRDLRQAADLDPTAPKPRELLGDVNYARHRYEPAAEHYQAYVTLDDRSPRVLYKLGLARYRSNHPTTAMQALQKALAIDDNFAEAHYLMGLCQRDAQRRTEAAASLLKAIALAPNLFRAREELADLYAEMGRTEAWLAQLDTLRVLDPSPTRDVALGLAYSKAGQSDRAVMTLRHATETYPKHGHTYVALGRVWLETAQARNDRIDLNKALEALEKAVAEEDSSESYTLFGRALLLAAEAEPAERILQQATTKLPVDPLAFYYLSDAAERRAHYAVARQALVDYVALAGEDADPRRRSAIAVRVADLSMRVEDFPTAISWYERAMPTLSGDEALVVKLADARARSGDVDVARASLDKLLEKNPANAAARNLRRRIQ
jgi:tetratricopeptide (TPR) repeat protein